MQITLNGEPHELPEGTTVAGLLESLHRTSGRVAVEINTDVVPRAEHAARVIAAGDRVEVVTFVGGG